MGFRQHWHRLLTVAVAAVVTVPLSLVTALPPDAVAAPRPAVPVVAPPKAGAPSDLDSKSVAMVFVRERDGRAPNAGKAHFAAGTMVDGQFAAQGAGAYPEWHHPGRSATTPTLDGAALSGAGDVDAEAGGPAVLESSPEDALDRVVCHRATRYRADVDPATHVPIRDMTQETDV